MNIKRRLRRLFNQSVLIKNRVTSNSADPNEINYNSGTENPCFKVSTSNTIFSKNYNDIDIDLLLAVFPDVAVKEQDRVVFEGLNYEVNKIDILTRGRTGETHHKILICKRDKKND